MAKQTGPRQRVKGKRRYAGALALAAMALSGCSQDNWYSPRKTPDETRADVKTCNDLAQENTLERHGQDRASYGDTQRMPQPRNTVPTGQPANLGETPMQLHDRVTTEKSFNQGFSQCMRDKGYTLGKPSS